ncbi:uncharacterized protein LOC131329997 isoform X2 [Rhododendron vialii]|uniref:uncharacterized protein LOC131329997 isoform X2 n=1 Tax=Rhododendron vialii TaxID=182163 RepID=UPI00265F558F|nr:uncharacterized protein LOC131329997 isoform X2 [Rhododendron vialii]
MRTHSIPVFKFSVTFKSQMQYLPNTAPVLPKSVASKIPSDHRTSLAKIDGQHMSMWYRMWRALSCQLHLVEVQLIVPLRTWNLSRSFTQKLRYIQQFLYYCFGAKDLSLNMFLENGKIVHLYAKLQIHSHKHPRVDFLYQLTFQWSVSDDKWICLRESDDQASRSH